MDLAQIIDIFWQDSIFHVLIVSLLAIAITFEILSVIRYWNWKYSEAKDTKKAITYLKNNIGNIENRREGTSTLDPNTHYNWFRKHLAGQLTRQGFEAQVEGGKFVLLQYPKVLIRSNPRSQLRFFPSILIALGVIGTFYGIQKGLSDISLSDVAGNSDSLLASSVTLLEGMKTAFSTSLMGLVASSLFTLIIAIGEGVRRSHRQKLRRELDQVAILETPARLLARLNSDDNLEAAKALNNAAKSLEKLSPEAIGQQVGQVMTPVFQEIREELQALREIKADQGQEMLRQLIEEQREQLIKPIIAELHNSAEMTNQASQAVTQLKDELGGISQSLAESIVTIQRFQEETLGTLKQFTIHLGRIFTQFRNETQGVMERVSTEIQTAVSQSIEGMEAQREAFETSANSAADTFRGIREDLQSALHTQAETERQILEEFKDRTVAIITAQTETITTAGNEASNLMNTAKDNLTATLSNIDTMLQKTRVTVQEELEQFRLNYQASLQEFFTAQNQLLEETLGEQREGLARVVETLNTVFKEEYERRQQLSQDLEISLRNTHETTKRISDFANRFGLASGQRLGELREIMTLMSGEADRIDASYQTMISRFNEALNMGNQHLANYLQQASESEQQFFVKADEATTKICNNLLQAASYLVAAENTRR
ncbi:MAG: hypothetical protein ACOC04_03230 [Halothece sp.]